MLPSCSGCSHRVSQWVKHAAAHAAAPADLAHPRQHPPTPRYIKPDKPSSDDEDEEPQQQQQPQAGYMSMGRAASAVSSATGDDNASAGQGAGGTADAGMLGVLPDGSEQEEDLAVDARCALAAVAAGIMPRGHHIPVLHSSGSFSPCYA